VIIIGSGASGIGAAIKLARKGIPFKILEARNRIGGRINSVQLDDV
jgi:monoamine oxidase